MKKYAVLALIASFMSMVMNPSILTASGVVVRDIDSSKAVETVVVPDTAVLELDSLDNLDNLVALKFVAETPKVAAKTVAPEVVEAPAAKLENYITVAGSEFEVVKVSAIAKNVGPEVYANGKMLYAHNTASRFGVLSTLKIGETFTVTTDGVLKTYEVKRLSTYTAAELESGVYKISPNRYGNLMAAVNEKALAVDDNGETETFDLALMTCAGTVFEDGSATHRLVVYANEK